MIRMNFFKKTVLVSLVGLTLISFLVGKSDLYRDISENWKLVYEVYRRIITHYADQIDPAKLASAGIRGMLEKLDPYSAFLEKEERDGLDVLTKGEYGGVGIQLGVRDDSLTVIAPMEDSPAKRTGILPGDRITAIDHELTKSMNLNDAAKRIRGKKGTMVVLTIRRFGEPDELDFELTRDNIAVKDVSYSGTIGTDIGYVRLSRFSRNSPVEMRKALTSLKAQGVNKYIIDLRGNPGGLLNAAIRVLDMLIEKGPEILYTKGRSDEAEREFVSQTEPIVDSSMALTVLIDGGTASASEIVSGVVQDLDRGIIIGFKSFGKGLVQSVYPLDPERSLKLTTAKYYMPSGRLIQKPDYLDEEIMMGTAQEDSIFVTRKGREVRANGGITPDILLDRAIVPPPLTRECWRRGLFFKFATLYLLDNEMRIPVIIDDMILTQFREYVKSKDVRINMKGEKQFRSFISSLDSTVHENKRLEHSLNVLEKYFDDFEEATVDRFDVERESLSIGLEREFSSILGGNHARIASSFDDDPAILKAVEVLTDQVTYDNTLAPPGF
ncbi:MAG: S41 family peptidase [Candidatus Neomarinimicrobiota bacterium]